MELWDTVFEIVILLAVALALGVLFERLRQSAILGYLAAGTLLGPGALNLMSNREAVPVMAELGVALLLFTIGLEFSWLRLRNLGAIGLGGGTLQMLLTGLIAAGIFRAQGAGARESIALG
ncbi:MAG TPA: cation:proton antiporter, partial [Phycisphaerae bacterium]